MFSKKDNNMPTRRLGLLDIRADETQELGTINQFSGLIQKKLPLR